MTTVKALHGNKKRVIGFLAAVVAAVFSFAATAGDVSAGEAKAAVQAWLAKYGGMEGTRLGTLADKEPAPYTNAEGRTLFYVLDLAGGGYVVASANTKIAPVITFTDKGTFDPNPENPEYAMLTGDMADRLEAVDEYEAKKASSGKRLAAGASSQTEDEKEWAALVAGTPIDYDKQARAARRASKAGGRRLGAGDDESTLPFANEPDGMRAPQMVTTTWKQAGDYALGEPVENRYTPDYRACGCVATAYAQIGHFWRWPKKRIEPLLNDGTDPFSIVCMIDGVVTNLSLMGGVYDFSMMPSSYGQIKNVRQAEEIGRFVHDVAVACGERWHGGAAGSNTRSAKVPFINIFGYANGREGWSGNNTTPFVDGDKTYGMENWELRIKRTLDVLLGGFDGGMPAVCSVPGHAILADGYQYVGGRLYVHFNFGWGGSSWYSFLNRDEYLRGYAQMRWVSQNIHPTIPGIVFSGRIYDEDGNAVEGAQVTLQGEFWDKDKNVVAPTNAVAMSNKYGIYHFRLQAVDAQGVTHHDGRFTVKANYAGLAESEAVTVERVKDWTSSSLAWKCDNLRGNDLTLTASTGRTVESVAIDGPSSATAGGKVQFTCKATLDDGTTRDVSPEWSIVLPDATGTTIDALTGEMSVGGVFDDKVTVRAVFTNLLQGAVLEAVKTVSIEPDPAAVAEDETPDYFVEWVQPESPLFIDTGVIGRSGTAVDVKMSNNNAFDAFSSMLGSWTANWRGGKGESYVNIFGRFFTNNKGASWIVLPYDTDVDHDFDPCAVGDVVRLCQTNAVDGTVSATLVHGDGRTTNVETNFFTEFNLPACIDTGVSMNLFAHHYYDQVWPKGGYTEFAQEYSAGRLYHAKIWQQRATDGEYVLVRDFKPCVKDGVPAIYDAVGKKIYRPKFGNLLAGDIVAENVLPKPPLPLDAPDAEEPGDTTIGIDAANTPDAFLDWVKSPGGQNMYLDTEVCGRAGTKMVFRGSLHNAGNPNPSLIGCVPSGGGFFLPLQTWGGNWGGQIGGNGNHAGFNVTVWSETSSEFTLDGVLKLETSVSTEPIQVASASPSIADATSPSLYLFNCNNGNGAPSFTSSGAFVGNLKIWQTREGSTRYDLVRDFRPCLKNGTAALFDRVTRRIFYPQGGTLEAGKVIYTYEKPDKFVEFVQSSGTQYLDLGVVGRTGTKIQMDVDYASGIVLVGANHHIGGYSQLITFGQDWNKYIGALIYGTGGRTPTLIGSGRHTITFEATSDGTSVWTIDASSGTLFTKQRFSTGMDLYLFGCNYFYTDGSVYCKPHPDLFSSATLYSMKIWQVPDDGTDYELVRDFRPCVKDGKAGLYDEVSGALFLPPEDSGALTAGPDVEAEADADLADYPATVWGRIDSAYPGEYVWRDAAIREYAFMGAGDTANLDGYNTVWQKDYLANALVRFDGWFKVKPGKAGTWTIEECFDDRFAFFIDGDLAVSRNGTALTTATVEVAEGWHRFTIVAGDVGGSYGSLYDFNSGKVPMVISVNGVQYAFNRSSFPQGTGKRTVTLQKDEDWSNLDLTLLDGVTIDLNGHNLVAKDFIPGGVGAQVVNSAEDASVLFFTEDPFATTAYRYGLLQDVGSKVMIATAGTEVKNVEWTGAADDGDATNPANWKESSTGTAVDSLVNAIATVSGNNLRINLPAGTDPGFLGMTIGACSLAADCDLSGLNFMPGISGEVRLNGFALTLPYAPSALDGCEITGPSGSALRLVLPPKCVLVPGEAKAVFDGMSLDATVRRVLVKSDNGISTVSEAINVNDGETGAIEQTAGTFNLDSQMIFGYGAGKTGTVTVNGGVLRGSGPHWLAIGFDGATGVVNVAETGYAEFATASVGGNTGKCTGFLNVSGNGTFFSRGWLRVANGAAGSYGEINQSGGIVQAWPDITVGTTAGATGVYNLSGGRVIAVYLAGGDGDATLNLSGGTFVANAHDQAAIANFDRIVYSGEFTFDSNGMTNLTMSGNADLSAHPGSVFEKTGVGSLTVGALPPTDTVRVSGGTLALAATEDGTSDGTESAGIDLATSASGDQSLVGVLDLGGRTLVRSSLALNGGELQNGTLVIDGFLEIPLDGSIVNRGELDLSDATIRLAEPENVRSGVVVKCSDGGVITGVPKRGNLPKGWNVRIVNGDLALTSGGTHIILR